MNQLRGRKLLVGQPLNYERHYLPRFWIVAAKTTNLNLPVRKAGSSRCLGHGWVTPLTDTGENLWKLNKIKT